jgi:DNA gyrase/topoisomerase IV subunit B
MSKELFKGQENDEHKVFDSVESQILHRPGMYIGNTNSVMKDISIYEEGAFIERELEIIPGIAKLVEEVVVNSVDEHIRTCNKKLRGWTLNKIEVSLSEEGLLKVRDNGGITSKKHSTGMYPIELIFGKLFSSSNYDDTKDRRTVGLNGVGGSLTNLFSKSFQVKSADKKNVVQVNWKNNKSEQLPTIAKKSKDHFTEITAQLDLERFGVDKVPYGVMKYIERLAIVQAASNPGLEITFNDEVFKFKNFLEYVKLYGETKQILGEENEDWEVYITPSNGNPLRYAIVNGAECNNGNHIRHMDWIISRELDKPIAKHKLDTVTRHMVKAEYSFFINMKIDKPNYADQAKTELTNEMVNAKTGKDGKLRDYEISNKLIKQIQGSFILDGIKRAHEERNAQQNSKELKKRAGELNKTSAKTVKKLLDAGAKKSAERKKCELWIFEGLSAGSGFRPNRDPEFQGCYFLKGKCVNSIEMSTIDVLKNKEFSDIIVALGLDVRNPKDLSKLRYGKVIISTDQDVDGHSIFGQLITLFTTHFPEMVEQGMIYRAKSPLHKAKKGKNTHYFYNTEEYTKFMKNKKGYETSYFKGLGSLEKEDYKVMIQESHLEQFTMSDDGMDLLSAFMQSDSKKRKLILESQV